MRAIQAWRWMAGRPGVQQSYIVRVPEGELGYHLPRIAVQQQPGLPAPSIVEVEDVPTCTCVTQFDRMEHPVDCPSYEPRLTQEEIRELRTLLKFYRSPQRVMIGPGSFKIPTNLDDLFAGLVGKPQVGNPDSAPETEGKS